MKENAMSATFGIDTHPRSMKWDDVRKGPPADAVLQHLRKVVYYRDMQAGPRERT
jgi:hypothetical protein